MMPVAVVCAARLTADELAAVELDVPTVLDGLSLLLALADGLLISPRANKAVKASEDIVSAANNFFAVVFFIMFCPLPDIARVQSVKKDVPSLKIREGSIRLE